MLDNFKRFIPKRRQPETPAQTECREFKEMNAADIRRFRNYIKQYSSQLDTFKHEGMSPDAPAFRSVAADLSRFQYCLYEAELSSPFIRENKPEDIEYRKQQMSHLAARLEKLLPADSDYRFHGTPIYFAKEIIKDGKISSTADRFDGYIKSTDRHNEISVSDISSLSRTVNWFMDMTAYQRCLPCGCLFVLSGVGQTEDQKKASIMNSVDFKRDPGKLKAIVTTPENIESLQVWLGDNNMSKDLAYTFDSFISELEKKQALTAISPKPPLSAQVSSAAARASTLQAGYIQQTRDDRSSGHFR